MKFIAEVTLSSSNENAFVAGEHRPNESALFVPATQGMQAHPLLERWLPLLVCAVMLGQLVLIGRQLSQTADEPTHIYSGYRYLKCGDLSVSSEHPPLAKIIAAAPLLLMNPAVDCTHFRGDNVQQAFTALRWFYGQNWRVALIASRAAAAVFAVGLCLLVWFAARRMFDFSSAVVASLLLVFEPNILAYGSLVLTDVPVTCTLLLAVVSFYLWLSQRLGDRRLSYSSGTHHGTSSRAIWLFLLTALATGLTLLTKHSGVALIPILGLLAVVDPFMQPRSGLPRWRGAMLNLLAVALICGIAVGIVWAGYGLRFAAADVTSPGKSEQSAQTGSGSNLLLELERRHVLPRAYLKGFAAASALPGQNSAAFVDGRVYLQPPWFSTPYNLVVRMTPAMLVMMAAGAFGIAMTFRKRHREQMFLLLPGAVYMLVCMHASRSVSMRYLLPALPFLVILMACGCVELARRARQLRPWPIVALICLLLLHAASSLHAYPNYLSYASDLWGGPAQAYKYLPWLDLGQAYPGAKEYLEVHPSPDCWLITGWQWDPGFYGVPCQTFGLYLPHQIPPHVRGTVIVSSTLLTDVRLAEGEMAAPFKNGTARVRDHIGGSALLVYQGNFDTSAEAAIGERNLSTYAASLGESSAALEHAKRAVVLAQTSALARANLCLMMAPTQLDSALKECTAAQALLLADPLRDEQTRRQLLESLATSISSLRNRYRMVYRRDAEMSPPGH